MQRCIELAGFAAAQVVGCLFDRQPFLPMAFNQRSFGERAVSVLPGGSSQMIAAFGRRWLDANTDGAADAVLATDGYVTLLPGARRDAIILDLRSYRDQGFQLRMAVPYRPYQHPAGFAVHRPKFIVADLAGHDAAGMNQAFFCGVFSHESGSRIWRECLDESW